MEQKTKKRSAWYSWQLGVESGGIDRWFIHTSYRPGTNPPTFPSRYAFTHIIPPRRAWIGVSENDSNTPAAVCYFRVSCDLAKLRQSPGQSTPLLIALLLRLHHTPSFSEKIPRKNRENSQMLGVVRVEVYLVQVKYMPTILSKVGQGLHNVQASLVPAVSGPQGKNPTHCLLFVPGTTGTARVCRWVWCKRNQLGAEPVAVLRVRNTENYRLNSLQAS